VVENMKGLHMITFILLVVGGLNWLLVGLFGWDIGEIFKGQDAVISRIIYILIGLSALYEVSTHKSSCKHCEVRPNRPIQPAQPTMP